jgi:hypothetical protein
MRKFTLCLIGMLAASALGCVTHEGPLAILMTSGPSASSSFSAKQINVEIIVVELWDSGSQTWVTVSGGSQVHELLGLEGRVSPIALVNSIERGNYTQVRVTFAEGNSSVVDANGRREPMRIEPTVITVQGLASVVEDATNNMTLELDLGVSLTERNSGLWTLRPVMRQIQ